MATPTDDPLTSAQAVLERTDWEPLRVLGIGGGGTAFLCVNRTLVRAFGGFVDRIQSLVSVGAEPKRDEGHQHAVPNLIEKLTSGLRNSSSLVAIKIPHADLGPDAQERFRREIDAMKRFQSGALIRLIDADSAATPGWFACEYHPGGDLSEDVNRARYQDNPLLVLRDLLPIARSLGEIHLAGAVHRDVKPKNIFCAQDSRLVLGDFGVVIPNEDVTRLTGTAPVHSRDWVPDWVQFGDENSYTSIVDVFALAKVAFYLLSGRNVMASQVSKDFAPLLERAASVKGLEITLELLQDCIVTDEDSCAVPNAHDFANRIEDILERHVSGRREELLWSFRTPPNGAHYEFSSLGHHKENATRVIPGLSGIPVRLSRTTRAVEARLEIFGSPAFVSFELGGQGTAGVGHVPQRQSPPGNWTAPIRLELSPALPAGWHDLTVTGTSGSGGISGFLLHAVD